MEVVFDSADGMGSNSLVSAAGCQALPAALLRLRVHDQSGTIRVF